MAAAYVRDTGEIRTTGTGQTSSGSFASLPAVGNMVIVGWGTWDGTNVTPVSITDNQTSPTNTYTTDSEAAITPQNCGITSTVVAKSSGTYTITIDLTGTTNTFYTWCAVEFSGINTRDQVTTPVQTGAGTTSNTTNTSGTLASADEVVFTVLTINTGINHTSVTASGYTALVNEPDGTTFLAHGIAYKIVAATTAVNAAWTWTAGAGTGSESHLVTYYAVAGGGPGPFTIPPRVTRPRMFAPGLAR